MSDVRKEGGASNAVQNDGKKVLSNTGKKIEAASEDYQQDVKDVSLVKTIPNNDKPQALLVPPGADDEILNERVRALSKEVENMKK